MQSNRKGTSLWVLYVVPGLVNLESHDSLCCRHFSSSGSIEIHFQGSSHSLTPDGIFGFLFLDCRIPSVIEKGPKEHQVVPAESSTVLYAPYST